MLLEHKKICIGSDIRSLLYSYFYNYYFIPYRYFHSLPCEYYENIDFVFKKQNMMYEKYKKRLQKILKIDDVDINIFLKSDIEDMLFNILGNKGQIFSLNCIDSYSFSDLNKVKLKLNNIKINPHIKFDECTLIDPLEVDDFIYFESTTLEEDRNNVYYFFQLKNHLNFYMNQSKYNHIMKTDVVYPQKMYFGDYKYQTHKYVSLSGVLTDKQLENDVLLYEDRLLEFAITKLVGEKVFKKDTKREKKYTKFLGKSIIPFTRNKYENTDEVKFIYKDDTEIIEEYIQSRNKNEKREASIFIESKEEEC